MGKGQAVSLLNLILGEKNHFLLSMHFVSFSISAGVMACLGSSAGMPASIAQLFTIAVLGSDVFWV